MSFEQFDFDRRIAAAVHDVGFERPTPIQEQSIPAILKGHDVLGLAQTGTGKTAAFMLPILQRLTSGPLQRVRALVLAPTRELAEQIHQATAELAKRTKVRSATVYGGVSKRPQLQAIAKGTEILVACPGRLLDHLNAGSIDLSTVEVLVLDEADRMCDMGFLPDIKRIIGRLPEKRQTLFFSATMPREIRALSESILRDPVTVQIGTTAPVETVSHSLFPVSPSEKAPFLLALLGGTSTGRVLVFTRTKHRAQNLATKLRKAGHHASALQGNMTQNQRQRAIEGYRRGKYDVLVATDIAARGIDVSGISHVINYDMPDTVDAYTHRIGRTGRIHRTGEAFTLAVRGDGAMIRDIERVLGCAIERRRLEGFDYGDFNPERQFRQTTSRSTAGRSFRPRGRLRGSGSRPGSARSSRG